MNSCRRDFLRQCAVGVTAAASGPCMALVTKPHSCTAISACPASFDTQTIDHQWANVERGWGIVAWRIDGNAVRVEGQLIHLETMRGLDRTFDRDELDTPDAQHAIAAACGANVLSELCQECEILLSHR